MDYQVNFISKLKKCNESDFKKKWQINKIRREIMWSNSEQVKLLKVI